MGVPPLIRWPFPIIGSLLSPPGRGGFMASRHGAIQYAGDGHD